MAEHIEPGFLLRDGQAVVDEWLHLTDQQAVPPVGKVTVSLERFEKERGELVGRQDAIGVRLRSDQPADISDDALSELALVVIEISKFSDGRHFSLARMIRERRGWKGELRARGDVLPDQLVYMKRCGYSSFELRADQSPETGLRLLSSFSLSYQGSGARPLPLYRRRAS
jgi:uncharacterized protein (DUF934 family)